VRDGRDIAMANNGRMSWWQRNKLLRQLIAQIGTSVGDARRNNVNATVATQTTSSSSTPQAVVMSHSSQLEREIVAGLTGIPSTPLSSPSSQTIPTSSTSATSATTTAPPTTAAATTSTTGGEASSTAQSTTSSAVNHVNRRFGICILSSSVYSHTHYGCLDHRKQKKPTK
jgi:hypothetical protein